jgi:hypothetical protein
MFPSTVRDRARPVDDGVYCAAGASCEGFAFSAARIDDRITGPGGRWSRRRHTVRARPRRRVAAIAARRQAGQRAEITTLRAQRDGTTRVFTAEVEHLAAHRAPAAARRPAHPHVVVPGPLNPRTAGTPLGLALENVLSGLQQRYDDHELAHPLFQLDHENEQSPRGVRRSPRWCAGPGSDSPARSRIWWPAPWTELAPDVPAYVGTDRRWHPPATTSSRTSPSTRGSAEIPVSTGGCGPRSANTRPGAGGGLDPAYYGPDAEAFEAARGADDHLAFGIGVHRCIGAPPARTEALTALSALSRSAGRRFRYGYEADRRVSTAHRSAARERDRSPVPVVPPRCLELTCETEQM